MMVCSRNKCVKMLQDLDIKLKLSVFFSSLCRQVVSGLDEMEAVFDLDEGTYPIKVTGDADGNSAIVSKMYIQNTC